MAQATLNLNALGIQDLSKAIDSGQATMKEVFDIVDARINKRIAEKRNLLKPVVEYRNLLASIIHQAGGGLIAPVPTPHVKVQPNAALPTDPEQLADVVFATVGAANVGAVINRLTSRVVGI
jgi:hypothetical protein